jgi:hypothetical protein
MALTGPLPTLVDPIVFVDPSNSALPTGFAGPSSAVLGPCEPRLRPAEWRFERPSPDAS